MLEGGGGIISPPLTLNKLAREVTLNRVNMKKLKFLTIFMSKTNLISF